MMGCFVPSFFPMKNTGAAVGVLLEHLEIIPVSNIPSSHSLRIFVSAWLRWYGFAGGGSLAPSLRLISKS